MKKLDDNKKFLRQLSEKQIKELIYLSLLNCDKENGDHYVENSTVDDIVVSYYPLVKKWDLENLILINSFIYPHQQVGTGIPFNPYFIVDDYSMIIKDGYFNKDISPVLHMYLTGKFGEEYADCVYQKRMELANKEREMLLENSSKLLEELESNQKKIIKRFK